jgi:hypothetical protein
MPEPAVQPAPELLARLQAQPAQQPRQQQGDAQPAAAGVQRQDGGEGYEPYLVPACAAWFSWDAISEVEEAHFKDFLSAAPENAERYRQYRNAIVNKYRWAPSR